MLRHLDEHPLPPTPPPAAKPEDPAPRAGARGRGTPPEAASDPVERRPRLMLRKLPLELALDRLERFVQLWRHQGVAEVIVVVGKGHGSPGGEPVLAPAVREWLDRHPQQIGSHEEAPAREGGSGAILVRLRP